MSYVVHIGYDKQESLYYVLSSEIPGLNIEARSVDEFVEIARDLAPDLIGERAAGPPRAAQGSGCRFVRQAGKVSHEV